MLAFWRRKDRKRRPYSQPTVLISSYSHVHPTAPVPTPRPTPESTLDPAEDESVQEWLVGKAKNKRRLSDGPTDEPKRVRLAGLELPPAVWERIVGHLAAEAFDRTTDSMEFQRHELARVCKGVPKDAAWATLVVDDATLGPVVRVFETTTKPVYRCSIEVSASPAALLASLTGTLVTLRLVGDVVPKGLKICSELAFRNLRSVRLVSPKTGALGPAVCRLVATCPTLKDVSVAGCPADFSSPSVDVPVEAPKARLDRLDLDGVPLTAHELLWLVGSSPDLAVLAFTLCAGPPSPDCPLVRAFDSIPRLSRLSIGQSWTAPYLGDIAISLPNLVELRLVGQLCSRALNGLPSSLRRLELVDPPFGPADLALAVPEVVVRSTSPEWRRAARPGLDVSR